MDLLPEYRHYPTVRENPVVLAFIARHVLAGAVEVLARDTAPLVPNSAVWSLRP
jgi:hypothetical protein